MDKYYINANSKGLIELVGIQTEKGFEKIEITDLDNPTKYVDQLLAIDEKYGNDFISTIKSKNVKLSSKKSIEKKYIEAVRPASTNLKAKILKRRIAAIAAAALVLVGSAKVMSDGAIFKDAFKNLTSKSTTESALETSDELDNKSVDELIQTLEEEEQKQAFSKIVATQDYFNEIAAPTVSQEDKQLFFKFDEVTSAYLYANSMTSNSYKMAQVFGKSKIMLFNEETGEYEFISKENLASKYLSFNLNLSYYYQLGATEKSGVDQIFENEQEAEFFRSFEAKILEYNRTKIPDVASEIKAELENIFMSGEIDSLMNKYEGACSIIGTSIVPHLYLNGVINEDMYNSLIEINESITCDDIYNRIGKITELSRINEEEKIIEQIAMLQDRKTWDLNRNVDMTKMIDGYKLDSLVLESTPKFSNSKTIVKHYKKATTSRKEAVKMAGEEAVKKAEEKEDKKLEEKNKQEEEKAKDMKDGYNDTYDDAFNNKGDNRKPNGSDAYNQGADQGVSAGKEDKEQADKDQEEYDKTHPEKKVEIISETFVEEKPKKVVKVESHQDLEAQTININTENAEYQKEAKVLVRE